MTWNVLGASPTLPTPNAGAESSKDATLSPRGEQLIVPSYQQYVNNERAYMISNVTRNTALATGGTSFSDTAPAFLLDVASGTTMRKLHVRLRQGGTIAGGVITCILTVDIGTRYSSGGTAVTVRNMKIGGGIAATNRRTSNVTAYSTTPTISAVNTAISLYSTILMPDVGAGSGINSNVGTQVNSPQTVFEYPFGADEIVPDLVGPASVILYTFAASTQPSWFFHMHWLELDT